MDIKEIILKKQEVIKNNQNAKYFVLSRLTKEYDIIIKKWQREEIQRLKLVYERNTINNVYNQQKYKKKKVKVQKNQTRLIK